MRSIFVNAHIIPESFCKRLVRNGAPAKVVEPNEYVKQSHIGVYDSAILCSECEARFSLPDDYAQNILLHKTHEFEPVVVRGELVAQVVKTYNYVLLHRFIMSVLWRASVSTQSFFKDVSLGPHEQSIKRLAFGENCTQNYPFWAGRLVHAITDNMMLAPVRRKFDGVNYWGVYVGDFHFWVKVDSGRRIPSSLLDAHAISEKPLVFICRELEGSTEHLAARLTAKIRKIGKGTGNG